MIVALGRGDCLVAIDRYSGAIPGVPRGLPEIDFFNPGAEAILALKPDVIIAHGHNETGAGSDPFALLREAGIPVVYIPLSPSIDAICEDLRVIARLLGAEERGEVLVQDLQSRVAAIAETGKRVADRESREGRGKKKVYFEISAPPGMATLGSGVFLDEMIRVIGAENIFADKPGVVFPSAEIIVEHNPDVILTNVPGPDPVGGILGRSGFAHIAAIENRQVYRIDTDASSRPSHHIVLALEQMARAVYPEYYEEQP
jgi:iron complex transport system substrate-binding protein